MSFIEIRRLSKSFGVPGEDGVFGPKDINCSIAEGSFVSIVRPSGCGKSTLLRIATGVLDHPDIAGRKATSLALNARRGSAPLRQYLNQKNL